MYMKTNKTTLVAALIVLAITASIAYAIPAGAPPTGNVDANFNSVKLTSGPKMTGSFGYWVKNTTTTYDGSLSPSAKGYASAQAICNGLSAGSHVCTAKEIINSSEYASSGVPVLPTTGDAWINNGPPSYVSSLSNDCNGWTSNEPSTLGYSVYGSTWKFGSKYSLISHCVRKLPIACCSY
jgi:hypothetical protein